MAISIPSKSEKRRLTLVDSLRILAWGAYKVQNQVSGLEGYDMFSSEWLQSDYVKMDLNRLLEAIGGLGYTEDELLQIRGEYYERRNKARTSLEEEVVYSKNGTSSALESVEEIPY